MTKEQNDQARAAIFLASSRNGKAAIAEEAAPKRRRRATPAQIAGNRANAQKSTGPRTPAGKAASSQNALRHGFTGDFRMMGPEDRQEFDELKAQLHADFKPANVLEAMILDRMAEHHWLVQRAIRYQNNFFDNGLFIAENFNSILRYHTEHERAFSRAVADHLKLRNQRLKEEKIGSVSQNPPTPSAEAEPAREAAPRTHAAAASATPNPECASQAAPATAATPAATLVAASNHLKTGGLEEIGFVSQNSPRPHPARNTLSTLQSHI